MSDIAAQNIITVSTELTVMDDNLAKLKNDQTEEIIAANHGGDLADQSSNSLTNIVKQLASTDDANGDVGFLSSALVPEPDIIDSCQSADDELILKTVFPVEELSGPVAEIEVKQSSSCSVSMLNPECDEVFFVILYYKFI